MEDLLLQEFGSLIAILLCLKCSLKTESVLNQMTINSFCIKATGQWLSSFLSGDFSLWHFHHCLVCWRTLLCLSCNPWYWQKILGPISGHTLDSYEDNDQSIWPSVLTCLDWKHNLSHAHSWPTHYKAFLRKHCFSKRCADTCGGCILTLKPR